MDATINPFTGYGTAVSGSRFVGRRREIELINQRVLGEEFSNLSITGLPKIGKSSLVHKTLVCRQKELLEKKTLIVYYQLGSTRSALQFYKKMVSKLHQFFEEGEICDEKYNQFAAPKVEQIMESSLDDVTDLMEKYYKKLRRWGYKIIYVLDEFDHARELLEPADFQALREMAYEPEDKICLVTCSRKPLNEIEKKEKELSVFAQIFTDCPITMFDEESEQAYWERIAPIWKVDDHHKDTVRHLVGSHPWLMDIVNDYFFIHRDDSETEVMSGLSLPLMNGFDHIIATLEEEQLLNDAIQLVVGPLFKRNPLNQAKLLKYGFLVKTTEDVKKHTFGGVQIGPNIDGVVYECFSETNTLDLYRRYYASIPYSSLWSETENKLREIIIVYLSEKYPNNWRSEMESYLRANPPFAKFDIAKWLKNVSDLINNKNKLVAEFPGMSGKHDVNFALTAQLFDIFIRNDWNWFTQIFSGGQNVWNSKFVFLTKVRNPIAHNNPGLSQSDIDVAYDYCKEICTAIDDWKRNNPE